MDEFRITWTKSAVIQRNVIFEYWNTRNKNNLYSKKLNLAIRNRLQSLKANPRIGKPTMLNNIRSVSMRHYSIIYQINHKTIFIIAFWDNRQNPQKLLKIIKSK